MGFSFVYNKWGRSKLSVLLQFPPTTEKGWKDHETSSWRQRQKRIIIVFIVYGRDSRAAMLFVPAASSRELLSATGFRQLFPANNRFFFLRIYIYTHHFSLLSQNSSNKRNESSSSQQLKTVTVHWALCSTCGRQTRNSSKWRRRKSLRQLVALLTCHHPAARPKTTTRDGRNESRPLLYRQVSHSLSSQDKTNYGSFETISWSSGKEKRNESSLAEIAVSCCVGERTLYFRIEDTDLTSSSSPTSLFSCCTNVTDDVT